MTTTPTSTARAINHTTITFGLVSVPVRVYSTEQSTDEIEFNMLHDADNARLKQQYACTQCNEVVDKEHTIKGYEHAKGQYVTFTAAEIEALKAVATERLDLEEYVPADAIDGIYIAKTYYLGPDKGADKAYQMLADALLGEGVVGVGRWTQRGKEHVVAVRPIHDGLALHQLRYEREVKPWEAVPVRVEAKVQAAELKLARQIIRLGSSSSFRAEKYTDRVHEGMLKAIHAKIDGTAAEAPPPAPPPPATVDLIQALKASLDVAKSAAPAPEPEPRRTPKTRAASAAKRKRAA